MTSRTFELITVVILMGTLTHVASTVTFVALGKSTANAASGEG